MSETTHLSLDTGLIESLADLSRARAIALGCVRCRLAATRTRVAFGEGPPRAAVVLVGEGPGENEDAQGRPFVGRAGQLLDDALRDAGLARESVYITNVVRCRPTAVEGARVKNRPPRADEIAACRVWMDTELRLVAPRVVVCLGALAAQALIAKGFRLTRDRGRWFPGPRGTEAVATIHPSYVLRQRGDAREQAQALLREDLALAAERVR